MTVRLLVKVVPGASRDAIAGWLGEALKVRVSAPPEKGKANKAVQQVIARALGLPSRDISVVAGQTNPRKTVEISGMDEAEVFKQLDRPG
ncbi:MAG: DUF167 domain-containing protein [Gammaproteobacteria bacterium]|nr:DUF167 domain-containing protein [Gammaproteobacteria bacterium]